MILTKRTAWTPKAPPFSGVRFAFLVAGLSAAAGFPVAAATDTWSRPTGSSGGSFSDGTNWLSGTSPLATDTIGSPSALGNMALDKSTGNSTRTVTVANVDVAFTTGTWSWLSQAAGTNTLVVTNNFKFDGTGLGHLVIRTAGASPGTGGALNASIAGTVDVLGGALEFGNASNSIGQLTVAGLTTLTAGSLNFFGNTVQLNGGLKVDAGTVSVYNAVSGSGGISANYLSGSGGTIAASTLTGTSVATLTIDGTSGSKTYSGALTNGTGTSLALTKTGASTQILTGASTYTGATTISAGTLLVDGSLGNTAVSVGTAGTLGGNGSIDGAVTVDGHFTPGDGGVGTLTVNNSLILSASSSSVFEISGVGLNDHIAATNLTLDGTITISLIGGFTPVVGNTFDLLDWSGTLTSSGFNVGTELILPSLSGGAAWDTSSFLTNGTISVISAVPEPGSTSLLGLGVALAFLVVRRRALLS